MCFSQDSETTVAGPGHLHHGGIPMSVILGQGTPLDHHDLVSPRGAYSARGGSLKGGSLFWSAQENSPRRGGSLHGGFSFRGEGSYRGGSRRGGSAHGGSVYRGGGNADHEGSSHRGSLRGGAPSLLGNRGGGLVRTLSSEPLLTNEKPFVYHGRVVKEGEEGVKTLEVQGGGQGTGAVRIGRESARGGTLFLKLQEKLQQGGGEKQKPPTDASDMV
jgi:hypothetical protein